MKKLHYIIGIAGILGASLASQAAVIISDDFAGRTITGTTTGNTLSPGGGWDVDLTGTASDLTSLVGAFSTSTGGKINGNQAFRADSFSFTFTPSDSYFLTDISVAIGAASSGGNNRAASGSSLTVSISNGGTIFTDTLGFSSPLGGYSTVAFDTAGTVLQAGTLYTFTAEGAVSSGFEAYNNLTLEGTAVPEPSSFALLGGLLALGHVMVRRRR